jgi:predicted metal-dependent RNase
MGHRIGGTAVHFYVNNQLFNLIVTRGFIQTDQAASQHGHADAHHLPGA